MVWLLRHCSLVMTDSGGLQKEAFFFEKHCIILRDETEWVELVENKFNILAGADGGKISFASRDHDKLLNSDFSMDLYGNGNASEIIVEGLMC